VSTFISVNTANEVRLTLCNSGVSTWFPDLHKHYQECFDDIKENVPDLNPFNPYSVFSAMTINLGPRTFTLPHRDQSNLAFGLCGDFVLGSFDHKKGGHVVLHEMKVVFEMMEGDLLLFQSACITHENIPIGEGEDRMSITCYTAGYLFSYRDQGFRTLADCDGDEELMGRIREYDREIWIKGWEKYSTLSSLMSRA
jgi:hypothetical protein